MRIGLDVGSTTLKCIVLDDQDNIIYDSYERHYSEINEKTATLLTKIMNEYVADEEVHLAISGSAGMGLANRCGIPFVQEVYATRVSVSKIIPEADVVIELGGEDAKILSLTDSLEVRMNGSCAGGTGAFIDQMSTLLDISIDQMNDLAAKHEKIYTVASRCGVFAKSDVQPLLNQGARKEDVAASIFYAVVNQTIGGLAQGRDLEGNIVYLGGPLTFMPELRKAFDNVLKTKGIYPANSLYFVALGAAFMSVQSDKINLKETIAALAAGAKGDGFAHAMPLFRDEQEYADFTVRHAKNAIMTVDPNDYQGDGYLGIDSGSTTIKMILIGEDENILYSQYLSNRGNPIELVKGFITDIYNKYPNIKIKSSAVTGYGEEIVKAAFRVDYGIVETIAHFTGAKKFRPNVDFIIDIGGQDMKCFKIKNGTVDNIFLNEACSSGCGSFLQTFAGALNYDIKDFAKLGVYAKNPVDLGSRCTVFMNSSVKQAQKDGATIEDISAGLSASVVKNAIYKVIRAASARDMGKNIVVQGGTFLNDAVLRAFELEINREVIRPNIAGLMGAYGAALYAKTWQKEKSTILTKEELESFSHKAVPTTCGLCNNHCGLTINTFQGNRRHISGNRCSRPLAKKDELPEYNLYDYKLELLKSYKSVPGKRGKIGLPMALNMYELLPFWHEFLTKLGFEVIVSPDSNREIYLKGQHTIPSDTICYPAKLVHGHIETLIDDGVETIFYPCMTYNLDEDLGDNHYNCPVVAYYPEVIQANVPKIRQVKFIYDYIGIHRPRDFVKKMRNILNNHGIDVSLKDVKQATECAFEEYDAYFAKIREKGKEYIKLADEHKLPVIILAGRPYHADPDINKGIDRVICQLGVVVISEDAVSVDVKRFPTKVLNQWTYHSRLYAAARYVVDKPNMNLIQLVSFGCGLDAITTDEVRGLIESENKIYTQIKIDEITNLGAVKIRLRSLMETLNQGKEQKGA